MNVSTQSANFFSDFRCFNGDFSGFFDAMRCVTYSTFDAMRRVTYSALDALF